MTCETSCENQAPEDEMLDGKSPIEADEHSPLRTGGRSLVMFDELLPKFKEMDVDLKNLLLALKNGQFEWKPPLK